LARDELPVAVLGCNRTSKRKGSERALLGQFGIGLSFLNSNFHITHNYKASFARQNS